MMPIFFHLESHLWIAYTLFFNGLLLTYLVRSWSSSFQELTSSFEATLASSFFLSIAINGLLLLWLDVLGLGFGNAKLILPVLSVVLIALTIQGVNSNKYSFNLPEISWSRLALYGFVFIVLFYNGGLIEHITDAWWHMSFANKIEYESTFTLSAPHLNLHNDRYYPPLWHGNLALIKILSGESLMVVWNSVTAWAGVVKVMCFYLLGLGVSQSKRTALFSAILFIVLPGVGNSYLRVSAWPAHIAYSAFFCLVYLFFKWYENTKTILSIEKGFLKELFVSNVSVVISSILLIVIILFSHKAELLWLFMMLFAYAIAEQFYYFYVSQKPAKLTYVVGVVFLLIAFTITLYLIIQGQSKWESNIDFVIVYFAPLLLLILFSIVCAVNFFNYSSDFFKIVVSISAITVFFLLINWHHLMSLFVPELASGPNGRWENALQVKGYFDQSLKVPGWHLQLRQGLLYSGVLSVLMAFIMLLVTKSRVFLFTFSTCFFALLICSSPYLYQWMNELLSYHSVWRVSLFVFHPLVYAAVIVWLLEKNKEGSNRLVLIMFSISLCVLLIFDGKYHFDKELVQIKSKHFSDQRNWSLFYPQSYVYQNSSIRYQNDLDEISKVIEPKAVVISDKATSYYLAASSPVYVVNVQNHHGRSHNSDWAHMLDNRFGCYIEHTENKDKLGRFLAEQQGKSVRISYLVLNRDTKNKNLKADCWAFRNNAIAKHIEPLASRVYAGEYLDLYKIRN